MSRIRLDQLVLARGLAPSRERARALILAGQITVDGRPADKAGTLVDDASDVALRVPDHPWVGRGGVKLAHALDVFKIDATGCTALDIGASTGGFTDVLLQRGARLVVALDVGRGQIDWRLRNDARVVVIEGLNARHLRPDDLPAQARVFDLIAIDVSFISLRHILPVLPPLLAPDGRVIALIKPQFEAGRAEVGKRGVVKDPAVHERVLVEVEQAAVAVGLVRAGVEPSPIEGAEGNREFLMLLTRCP
jgi:23S rRNA (cytidine1920-2'-O)/16S rRNA (cytidine1409-2'-O)-methyltransferase